LTFYCDESDDDGESSGKFEESKKIFLESGVPISFVNYTVLIFIYFEKGL